VWTNRDDPRFETQRENQGRQLRQSHIRRTTPLEPALEPDFIDQEQKQNLKQHLASLDPFRLSKNIDRKILRIKALAARNTAQRNLDIALLEWGVPTSFTVWSHGESRSASLLSSFSLVNARHQSSYEAVNEPETSSDSEYMLLDHFNARFSSPRAVS
jgi:hypothetical protein